MNNTIKSIETIGLQALSAVLALIAAHAAELSPTYSILIAAMAGAGVNLLNGYLNRPAEKIIAQVFRDKK